MKVNLREIFSTAIAGALPKDDETPEVTLNNVENSSKTSDLYKERLSYKEQVNDKNLPIGNKNILEQNLNNQLDTWYERPNYAKYDNRGKLIVSAAAGDFITEFKSGFKLLNFVADAAEEFFRQYNVVRKTHPRSKLNNITILRAYEKEPDYNKHLDGIYKKFFNDVLDPIKHTKKIKNIKDFIDLFFNWFIDQDTSFTRSGFAESNKYTIYNTGLAFDFFNVETEEDKAAILNDVRWPTLNYVAKVNGLRIDSNNPGRLIADIRSSKLIELYATKYFTASPINDIPEKILETYFKRVNGFSDSNLILINFIIDLTKIYNRFAEKYFSFTDFDAEDNIRQLFKKEFQTNKIARKKAKIEDFEKLREDGLATIGKYIIDVYCRMRLKENNITISEKLIQKLVNDICTVQSSISSKNYKSNSTFQERLYTNSQPLNILEAFLLSQKGDATGNKKGYVFLWGDGKRQSLTGTEKFVTLVQEDDEGLISSEVPEDLNPFS